MSKRLLILFFLPLLILPACSGETTRPDDAAPLPDDIITLTPSPTYQPTPLPVETSTPTVSTQSVVNEVLPTAEVSPLTNPGITTNPALVFNLTGGIVGFCDKLTINNEGTFILQTCKQDTPIQGTLEPSDQVSLKTWHDNLAGFQVNFEDNPAGADNLVTELLFNGQGQIVTDENQQRVIVDWANGLILRLDISPQAETLPKTEALPTPTPEPIVAPDAGVGLCSGLTHPALLTIDYNNPNTLVGWDVENQSTCPIILAHSPFGRIFTSANNLYYPVFDPESQTVKIWKYQSDGTQTPLEFTTVAMPEPMPFDFVLSHDGTKLAWAWTEIETANNLALYRNNLSIALMTGDNLVLVLNQAENTESRFVAPLHFAQDGKSFFYALQPDLGGPIFGGRYDTLYNVTLSNGQTHFMYACPAAENPMCIGGVTPDGKALTIIQPLEGLIQVLNDGGGLISSLTLPATDYIERTAFSPAGNMAFVTATLSQAAEGEPPYPNPGYISYLLPPYAAEPQILLRGNSVGTLLGWLDDERLIFGTIKQDGSNGTAVIDIAGQVTEVTTPNIVVGVLR